jgi:TusE/DsrC/DsvC family sulfur relay protein
MGSFTFKDKTYQVDSDGFLSDFNLWDENFAEGVAAEHKITGGLTDKHWEIIRFIRNAYKETGKCPLVYEACRRNKLKIEDLKELFPTGYLRGACKLAGLTYKEGYLNQSGLEEFAEKIASGTDEKTYEVDVRGFLIDPNQWDEKFALFRAYEMKMPEKLTEEHWKIINYLRDSFKKSNIVPTVYHTCEDNGITLEQLEKLFPDGYHRGAVKIAGLRVR